MGLDFVGQLQTQSGCKNFRTGRSKPAIQINKVTVINMTLILPAGAPVTNQLPPFAPSFQRKDHGPI